MTELMDGDTRETSSIDTGFAYELAVESDIIVF